MAQKGIIEVKEWQNENDVCCFNVKTGYKTVMIECYAVTFIEYLEYWESKNFIAKIDKNTFFVNEIAKLGLKLDKDFYNYN